METVVTEEVIETVETPATETKAEESVTFTQEQVNELVKERLARAKKDIPSKDELSKFKEWQEAQKTEAEKQAEQVNQLNKANQKVNELNRKLSVLETGVNKEDIDYVLFKVGQMEGEFNDNLENFLKENPKYLGTEEVKTTGVQTKQATPNETGVTAILKARHPELFN